MLFLFSTYGRTTSESTREKVRKTEGFESFAAAKARTEAKAEKVAKGLKQPKDHVGSLSSYSCDYEGCIEKV